MSDYSTNGGYGHQPITTPPPAPAPQPQSEQ